MGKSLLDSDAGFAPSLNFLVDFMKEKKRGWGDLLQAGTWGRVCRQKPVFSGLQTEPAPVCSPASGTYADLSDSHINTHVEIYVQRQARVHVHKCPRWETASSRMSIVIPHPRRRQRRRY